MSYGFYRGKAPTAQTAIDFSSPPPEIVIAVGAKSTDALRAETRAKGFTGNQCSNCGSINMITAGHCEVCTACGTTTGCS